MGGAARLREGRKKTGRPRGPATREFLSLQVSASACDRRQADRRHGLEHSRLVAVRVAYRPRQATGLAQVRRPADLFRRATDSVIQRLLSLG